MKAASTFSRRKICSKVRLTEVVPAPEEPVIEMIGMLARHSCSSGPEQAAHCRTAASARRSGSGRVVAAMRATSSRRAEDQRRALVQALGHESRMASMLSVALRRRPARSGRRPGWPRRRAAAGPCRSPPRCRRDRGRRRRGPGCGSASATSDAIQRMLKSRSRGPRPLQAVVDIERAPPRPSAGSSRR